MDAAPEERRTYGEYDIERLLGKGSIGKVYLARHRRLGRRVALKIIRPEQRFDDDADRAEFHKRLQREAELLAALHHPNLVTLFEAGYEEDVVAFLATEYVEGESLQARLKKTRPLPLDEALRISADILRALAYAHGKGVIHRDVKPANILLTHSGEAKITDFGIARPVNSSLTSSNSLLGTPNYMSPEQVKSGFITPRADLFSAGVVMYEMLTGVKPFAAADISGILYNVVNLEPTPVDKLNPKVPRAVWKIVAKLLSKAPAARYATAAEALEDVLECGGAPPLSDGGGKPPHSTDDETMPITQRRRTPPPVVWIIMIGPFLLLGGMTWFYRSRARAEQPAGVMTLEQRATFEAKKRELGAARATASAGKYEEAVGRYTAYLQKYPDSRAAAAERDAVIHKMIEDRTIADPQLTPPPKTAEPVKPEPEKPPQQPPPSRWDRVKRWFRGK